MKKFTYYLLIVTFNALFINATSQEVLNTYENTILEKEFDIQLSKDKKGLFTIWIDAYSADKLHDEGGLMVKEKQYPKFLEALKEAQNKYNEWCQTAKENNVLELNKKMEIKCKIAGYFIYGKKWHFDYNVNLIIFSHLKND